MRLLATTFLLLALPSPAQAQLANDKGPSLAVVVERCFRGTGDDGSWLDQLDWAVLCDLAQDAFEGGGRSERDGSGDPTWASPARAAFDAQWPTEPEDDIALLARERQRRALDAGVEAIQSLTEPWDARGSADTVRGATLELHLYARILDDAIDEGGRVHRQQALMAQNLLWRSCTTLALASPGRRTAVEGIIAETVEAAAPHSAAGSVARWGKKNHHLLVAPALLAPASADFDGLRTELSWGIWALQVSSELREQLSPADIAAIRDVLTAHNHPAHIRALRDGGWSRLSEVYLIGVLQAIAVVRENE
jgi:hypothetical protein